MKKMFIKTLSVTDINNYIKKVIDNDFILNNASIKGEISNFKLHSSGHLYFSLKDEFSKLNCVMFRSDTENLTFIPQDGMKVIVKGKISDYVKDGTYQLYCKEIKLDGLGELFVAFEKLKVKLESEGLFDIKHKKAIPEYPLKIGVITSPSGAAIRDIIHVIKRRNRLTDVLIYPTLVQGTEAADNIIEGINYFNNREDIDVVILSRGGGSIEELWAFNEEKLAYEIYNSNKPIITGIGHEIDFTIADFVSDKRAATPSAAAEVAVKNIVEINEKLQLLKSIILKNMEDELKERYNNINKLSASLDNYSPTNFIINQYDYIQSLIDKLNVNLKFKMSREKEFIGNMNALLNAHNPLNVLNKGYSIIQDEEDKVISNIDKLEKENIIKVTLKNGHKKLKISEVFYE
jgi:exodeoxyribonuclease VII large subunit